MPSLVISEKKREAFLSQVPRAMGPIAVAAFTTLATTPLNSILLLASLQEKCELILAADGQHYYSFFYF